MSRKQLLLLLSIPGFLLFLSMFSSGSTEASPVLQATITPTAFAYLPMVAKPVSAPTLEPCDASYTEYRGVTDQGRPISLCVKRDSSAVTRVLLNFSITCGDYTDYGAETVWEHSSEAGFPVENRAFQVAYPYAFEVAGAFSEDFSAATGTWQGIIVECSGWPGPCWEHCRGPVGEWNASRQP
jgi:hypothetical protein